MRGLFRRRLEKTIGKKKENEKMSKEKGATGNKNPEKPQNKKAFAEVASRGRSRSRSR